MRRPARARAASGPTVEILLKSTRWKAQPRAAAIIRKAIAAAAKAASTPPAELAIVLTNDSSIRALNRDWRGLDAPTNVLSFPAGASKAGPRVPGNRTIGNRVLNRTLGDIVIAYQTMAREARDEDKPFAHHLAHLAVHGYLHLLGYDHDNDRDAHKMERLEAKILKRLGVPDPYAGHPPVR